MSGPGRTSVPRTPGAGTADLLDASALSTSYDWGYSSEDTYPGRTVAFERARVLGGCSSHNGCAAIWGARTDYDSWGIAGWATDDLLPHFQAAMRAFRVFTPDDITPFQAECIEAARAVGIAVTDGLNDLDEHEAIGISPVNIVDGVRYNAAFAFLDRSKLTIVGDAPVERILFDGTRATGVVAAGREYRAERVVLAGGTYESPAILLRSDIGPQGRLLDLRVGENLHGHPAYVVGFAGGPQLERAHAERTTWTPEEQSIAKLRSSHCEEAFDLHLYPIGGPHPQDPSAWRWEMPVACITPRSRGSVTFKPDGTPKIDHAYLTDPHDLDVLADGVERMREIAAKMPRVGPELGDRPTGDALKDAIRRGVEHYYHPVGTCALGTVLNDNGAVIGAENLYVADCSIIPTIPRANTNVPAAAIGLRVAEALLAR